MLDRQKKKKKIKMKSKQQPIQFINPETSTYVELIHFPNEV